MRPIPMLADPQPSLTIPAHSAEAAPPQPRWTKGWSIFGAVIAQFFSGKWFRVRASIVLPAIALVVLSGCVPNGRGGWRVERADDVYGPVTREERVACNTQAIAAV